MHLVARQLAQQLVQGTRLPLQTWNAQRALTRAVMLLQELRHDAPAVKWLTRLSALGWTDDFLYSNFARTKFLVKNGVDRKNARKGVIVIDGNNGRDP